jgi:hypothetical protein
MDSVAKHLSAHEQSRAMLRQGTAAILPFKFYSHCCPRHRVEREQCAERTNRSGSGPQLASLERTQQKQSHAAAGAQSACCLLILKRLSSAARAEQHAACVSSSHSSAHSKQQKKKKGWRKCCLTTHYI